jgi:hypothetical protein
MRFFQHLKTAAAIAGCSSLGWPLQAAAATLDMHNTAASCPDVG